MGVTSRLKSSASLYGHHKGSAGMKEHVLGSVTGFSSFNDTRMPARLASSARVLTPWKVALHLSGAACPIRPGRQYECHAHVRRNKTTISDLTR